LEAKAQAVQERHRRLKIQNPHHQQKSLEENRMLLETPQRQQSPLDREIVNHEKKYLVE
jgi:hypothetical protein